MTREQYERIIYAKTHIEAANQTVCRSFLFAGFDSGADPDCIAVLNIRADLEKALALLPDRDGVPQ